MDRCIVLLVLLLVPCSTVSQDYIINLLNEETTEQITSPNYPNDYDNNADIIWEVIASSGFRVMVQFTSFNVQVFDSLRVYQGLTHSFEDAEEIARLWGITTDNISTIGSYLWLRFTTDSYGTNKGFSLLVSVVETVIINLTSEETIVPITSPNYPDDYDNNADIIWKVIAPTGFRVRTQFTDFYTDRIWDKLRVYHGLTNSFEDTEQRAFLWGTSLPHNISSIGSYLWLWFTSDNTLNRRGFASMVSAVETDWACDFKDDTCGLVINEEMWKIGKFNNYHYIRAIDDVASFTLNHAYTSRVGTLSFAHNQSSSGSLIVTVCKSQDSFSYGTSYSVVTYQYITYLCKETQDVKIMFTATRDEESTSISVLDIQLYESSILSAASSTTVIMNTRPLQTIVPESIQSEAPSNGSASTPSDVIGQHSNVTSIPGITGPASFATPTATSSAQSSVETGLSLGLILISTSVPLSAMDIIVVIVCLVCGGEGLKYGPSQGIAAFGETDKSPGMRDNSTFESSNVHDLRMAEVVPVNGANGQTGP